jgi:hypothetical protein
MGCSSLALSSLPKLKSSGIRAALGFKSPLHQRGESKYFFKSSGERKIRVLFEEHLPHLIGSDPIRQSELPLQLPFPAAIAANVIA